MQENRKYENPVIARGGRLDVRREIKTLYPQVKVLILTMPRKKEFLRQSLAHGADGFLLKEDPGS